MADHKDLQSFADELGMDEELCPELAASLNNDGTFPVIQHPLVYSVPYLGDAGRLNRQLAYKQEAVETAYATGRWSSFVYLHERPYRFEAFCEIEDQLTDTEYWSLLADVWVDTENAWQNLEQWYELWNSGREQPESVGEPLPPTADPVTIYRGVADPEHDGISWTLSYDKAKWFALRFREEGHVISTVVKRKNIWWYSDGRNEQEVLVHAHGPKEIFHVRQETGS